MTFRPIYRALVPLVTLAAGLALTTTAQAAVPAGKAASAKIIHAGRTPARPRASATTPVFHPRIGPALGIFPALTSRGGRLQRARGAVSYTHLTLPTTPYV